MANVYEQAMHYYRDYTPPLWSKARLAQLVKVGQLTEEQVKEITGETGEEE